MFSRSFSSLVSMSVLRVSAADSTMEEASVIIVVGRIPKTDRVYFGPLCVEKHFWYASCSLKYCSSFREAWSTLLSSYFYLCYSNFTASYSFCWAMSNSSGFGTGKEVLMAASTERPTPRKLAWRPSLLPKSEWTCLGLSSSTSRLLLSYLEFIGSVPNVRSMYLRYSCSMSAYLCLFL